MSSTADRKRPSRQHRPSPSRRTRPAIEVLENRLAPANFTVINTNDSGAGSLRQALIDAQLNAEADFIDFNLPDPSDRIITAQSADTELEFGATAYVILADYITIDGSAAPGLQIQGSDSFRAFAVGGEATLTLMNLEITNSIALGGNGGGGEGGGGGGAGLGGAIFVNGGSLNVIGVTFEGNRAQGGSGGADTVTPGNVGGGGGGGAPAYDLDDGSPSSGGNGSADNPSPGGPGGGGGGGAGLATSGFSSSSDAGGAGGTGASGGGAGGAGGNDGSPGSGGDSTDSTISGLGGGGGGAGSFPGAPMGGNGGFGGGGGGGGSYGFGGTGGFGGGAGGGISNFEGIAGFAGGDALNGYGGGGAGLGGAIFSNGGTVTITNSTFVDNTAIGGPGYNQPGMSITIEDVQAAGKGAGGAIFAINGTLIISNSTFTGNSTAARIQVTGPPPFINAAVDGGEIYIVSNASVAIVELNNNIFELFDGPPLPLAAEVILNSVNGGTTPVVTGGNNLVRDNTPETAPPFGIPGSVALPDAVISTTGPALLGPLQDNGGPTRTRLPGDGSAAIDGGDTALIPPGVTTDQRGAGFPRTSGGSVDIGAVEGPAAGTAPQITSAATTAFAQGTAGTFTITTTGTPTATLTFAGTLPAGVTFTDNGDGTATLAGTPTASGTFTFVITASNGFAPDATQNFALVVTAVAPPAAGDVLLITGAGAGGQSQVNVIYSDGSSFSFLAYTNGFAGGVNVAVGDVTGDGLADIVTGAGPGDRPEVKVFDGAGLLNKQAVLVADFFAYALGFSGGVNVAIGRVLSQNGPADIVTGAGAGGLSQVNVFRGGLANLQALGATPLQPGTPARAFLAWNNGFSGGVTVAVADVDGVIGTDGQLHADIIVGAGPGAGPEVKIFNGQSVTDGAANPTLIADFFAMPQSFTGGIFVAAQDMDGDGKAEVLAGAGAGGLSQVTLYRGLALTQGNTDPALSFFAYGQVFTGGVRVTTADRTGDGIADEVLTGAGPGGGPQVNRYTTAALLAGNSTPIASFFADPPSFKGGVFVAGNRLF